MKVTKKENKIQYSTRLSPEVILKIKKQSSQDGVSQSDVIEYLVNKYIK